MTALVLATEETLAGSTLFWFFVAAVVLIALNALYVAYEFAILTAKRSTFESSRKAGTRTSKLALDAMSDLSTQLAGAQLGITMATLVLGYVGEPAFATVIERVIGSTWSPEVTRLVGLLAATSIVVFLHLVLGEMVPKNIAIAAPDATLRLLVWPYRLFLLLFRPFIVLLNGMANAGCRLIGVEPRGELVPVHSASELAAIVNRSHDEGAIKTDEAQMLSGALDFAQRPVGEVATPLDEVTTLRFGATVAQAERTVATSGQQRLPISSSDQQGPFIGYVHARDLLGVESDRRLSPLPTDLVRSMAIVRSDRSLVEVLRTLRRVKRQMALVVDEEGTSIGIISVEEVIRALVRLRGPSAAGTGGR